MTKRAELGDNSGSIAGDHLRTLVERIERMDEEIASLTEDRKEIFVEAKSAGYDIKTIKQMLALRKLDLAERQEREALRDLYAKALRLFE